MAQASRQAKKLIEAARELSDVLDGIDFSNSVPWVYNPFSYAIESYSAYVRTFVKGPVTTFFMGMNPGPWGMAQTGVPFGEVDAVRRWLKVEGKIGKPSKEHPKRPVEGLGCAKSEVSGRRFWGLMEARFGTPQAFFDEHFVGNYCPLAFMAEGGANITPDKLGVESRTLLEAACDQHLRKTIEILKPKWLIGIGGFAEECFRRAIPSLEEGQFIGRILHPSPASPAANRDWSGVATRQLVEHSVWPK